MDGHDVILSIKGLTKSFPKEEGSMVAIENFNLEVHTGEFICILGPSGCGKTTVLRIIAGLQTATGGSLTLNGKEITGPGSDRMPCSPMAIGSKSIGRC
jgi:NitT/TauT family transport system ATP-binding protein